jgi:hypothetical protein
MWFRIKQNDEKSHSINLRQIYQGHLHAFTNFTNSLENNS